MNKKFFAALASATMALSATGSLAVFADDFDTVDETNWVTGNVVDNTEPDGSVKFDEENFPSKDFRNYLKNTLKVKIKNGYITKEEAEKVTKIEVPAGVKNVEGVQYFTNLTEFVSNNSALSSVNLTKNTKLVTVNISNTTKLNAIDLPTTNTLKNLTVTGVNKDTRAPLPILDLSGNKGLNNVNVYYTDIAVLDFSANSFLQYANVSYNKLNTIKLDGALNLTFLAANNNHLYSIDLPVDGNLATLYLQDNKLQTLDVTHDTAIADLNVANNCLDTLDLTNNTALSKLDASANNLGYLDLSKNKSLNRPTVSPQHTFVDEAYDEVDLTKNFEGFNSKKASIPASAKANASYSKSTGVLKFKKDQNAATYQYVVDLTNDSSLVMDVVVVKADLMNRLYNPNSGEHFYTKDINEKDVLVSLGWQDEGIGWVAPGEADGGNPVYRLYNPNAGDHHYTEDSRERDALVSAGWKSEGIGWYSPNGNTIYSATETGSSSLTVSRLPLFREYNPNAKAAGAHNYTLNEAENDFLCSIGWIPEGIAWYGLK